MKESAAGTSLAMPTGRPLPQPAYRYDPFYAIWRLEEQLPDGPPLGHVAPSASQVGHARQERIRLRPDLSLALPAADLEALGYLPGSHDSVPFRALVVVNFFGLYGATSPLPVWYTEALLHDAEALPADVDGSVSEGSLTREFLDLFNHRLLSLRYRAFLYSRPQLTWHRREPLRSCPVRSLLTKATGLDVAARQVGADVGLMLEHAGLWLLRTRPAGALQALLQDLLSQWLLGSRRCRVAVRQLAEARWLPIPPEYQPRLKGLRCGRNAMIGKRQLSRANQLAVCIGPVSYAEMQRLLPGGSLYERLRAWLRSYLRQPFDVKLEVRVPTFLLPAATLPARGEVAELRLGKAIPPVLRRSAVTGRPGMAQILLVGDAPQEVISAEHVLLRARDAETAVTQARLRRPDLVVLSAASLSAADMLEKSSELSALPILGLPPLPASGYTTDYLCAAAEMIDDTLWNRYITFSKTMSLT